MTLYITYCTSYGNSGSVISTNSNLDIDANDIYKDIRDNRTFWKKI